VTAYLVDIGAPDDMTGVEDELDLPANEIKALLREEQEGEQIEEEEVEEGEEEPEAE
jgi:hypothetical protein